MMRCLILILCLLLSGAAQAATAFFEGLSDVPIMQGLQELPERTLIFDKPSGRIAQVTALWGAGGSDAEVERFYKASLPQLGWQASGVNVYVREGEKLTISRARESGQILVVFRLEPR